MLPLWIRLYRLLFGVIAIVAVFVHWRSVDAPNFWRFFTIQSNMLVGVVLLLGASTFLTRSNPQWWEILRACAVFAITMTGVVNAILLDGIYNPFSTDIIWQQSVHHQLIPLVALIDFLIIPMPGRISYRTVIFFPIYPLVFFIYSLVRGARVDWYPYPFIDHRTYDNGYIGVFTTVTILVVAFLAIGYLFVAHSRWRGSRS